MLEHNFKAENHLLNEQTSPFSSFREWIEIRATQEEIAISPNQSTPPTPPPVFSYQPELCLTSEKLKSELTRDYAYSIKGLLRFVL